MIEMPGGIAQEGSELFRLSLADHLVTIGEVILVNRIGRLLELFPQGRENPWPQVLDLFLYCRGWHVDRLCRLQRGHEHGEVLADLLQDQLVINEAFPGEEDVIG